MTTSEKAVEVLKTKYGIDARIYDNKVYLAVWNDALSDTIDAEASSKQVLEWASEYVEDVWSKVYNKLINAQNECFDAKEHKLFDMCTYHIDIIGDDDLDDKDAQQMLEFADSVYKIANLKKGLNPLV